MRMIFVALFGALVWAAAPSLSSGQDGWDSGPAQSLDIQFVRPASDNNLRLGEPVFTRAGQLSRVHLEVTNRSSRARTLEYRFEWFDADGVPRQTLSATQTLFLDPGESRTLQSVAQHGAAVNARVTIGERR